jgi:hypothetical protein
LILTSLLGYKLPNFPNPSFLAYLPLSNFYQPSLSPSGFDPSPEKILQTSLYFAEANLLANQPQEALMFAAVGEYIANEFCFSKSNSKKTKLLKISSSLKCGLVYHALNQLVNIQRDVNMPGCFEIGNDSTQNKMGYTSYYKNPWQYHDDLTPFDERNSETIKKLVDVHLPDEFHISSQELKLCKFEILAQMFVGENLEKLEYMKQREQRLEHCLFQLKVICKNLVEDDFIFSIKSYFIETLIQFLKETYSGISKKIHRVSMVNISINEEENLDAQQNDIIIDHIDKLSTTNLGESKIMVLSKIYKLLEKLLKENPRYGKEWIKLETLYEEIFEDQAQEDLIKVWSYISTLRLNSMSHSKEILFLKIWCTKIKKLFQKLTLFWTEKGMQKQWDWNPRYQRVFLVFRAKLLVLKILKSLNFFSDGFVQARNFMANYEHLFEGTLYYKQLKQKPEFAPLLPDWKNFVK